MVPCREAFVSAPLCCNSEAARVKVHISHFVRYGHQKANMAVVLSLSAQCVVSPIQPAFPAHISPGDGGEVRGMLGFGIVFMVPPLCDYN